MEESRRLRATTPSDDGLARLADALGEPVEVVSPLHGGVATSTHLLATPTREVVIKRFIGDADSARSEWRRLQVAARSAVPTPAPIALDADGDWFGMPALVMARLPGRVVYPPQIDELAGALAVIHATPLPEVVPEVLRRPPMWATWEVGIELPPGAMAALGDLQACASEEPTVLAHCDFHPGNVLIHDGAVSGVVDWSSARLAARGLDVALMRGDLAVVPGGDAPDRFLAAYEAASGVEIPDVALWDVLAAARALEHGEGWVDAWTDVGIDVTVAQIRDRAEAFALAALEARGSPGRRRP